MGKAEDRAIGRVVDRGESGGEFCQRPRFDVLDQVGEDGVKETDLLVVEIFGIAEKKLSDASENFRAPVAWACGENLFKFVDNGRDLQHSCLGRNSSRRLSPIAVGSPHALST